ncbi:hypothetical protein ACIP5Y_30265 [Nocardia sp. NPDC088792]|uniref:hypothetical protein n=1 Tax=Nocardia sp. NPDC088792 TaxID=3364332 RepID=UPI00381BFD6D
MNPLDPDAGVIAPAYPVAPAAAASTVHYALAPGALPDLPVGQLPADVPAFEPPAFALSRKEFEQGTPPLTGGVPQGPGSPQGAADAVLGGTISPAVDAAHGVLAGAQQTLGDAQDALSGAQAALDSAPAAFVAAQTALARAAANPAALLPPLSADPVGDLMKGLALPAVPGLDALFKPFLDLINSFGTGVMGALNPATLLSQASQFIEGAVQVGGGALKTVEGLWQGKASQCAQDSGVQAQNHGKETSQRGFDLSSLTEQAAGVVQRGNIQLTAIAQSFAAQATALAPVALTPPGQTALITSATEHLASAVSVVNVTRGELSGYTAQVNGLVAQLLGQGNGPNPADVAQSLAQNVGQPILDQAKGLLDSGLQAANQSGPGNPAGPAPGGAPDTMAAGLGDGGAGGGGGGLGGGGLGGGLGGVPSTPGRPGQSVPGGKAPGSANPFGSGIAGMPGAGGPGSQGFMGSPGAGAGAGGRGSDSQHSRTVQPYQNQSGESELTGNLGASAPGVIGGLPDDPDGIESDQT